MSWTVSDEEFSVYQRDVLRARPLGALAASAMGVAAIAILSGALWFARPARVEIAAETPAASAPTSASLQRGPQAAPIRGVPAVVEPVAGFDLDAPEFAKEKKTSAVQRREAGGGRQDTLSLGEFQSGRPYLRLDIRQTVGEKLGNSDFYLDMARHAASAGLTVARIGPPTALPSRFGSFESAELRASSATETGAPAAGGERGCLAVRLQNARLSIEIAGLACGAAGKALDRRTMGCVLDRLRYVPASDSQTLEQFFKKAEAERGQACAAPPPPAKQAEPEAQNRKKRGK